jgi:hypothetical protein
VEFSEDKAPVLCGRVTSFPGQPGEEARRSLQAINLRLEFSKSSRVLPAGLKLIGNLAEG